MKLYVYIYKCGDRSYKLVINATSDEEASQRRDKLFSLYVNHASRLEEILQHKGIKSDWDVVELKREKRIKEVQLCRERAINLQLDKKKVLSGEERDREYVGRRMSEDYQELTVLLEGQEHTQDSFSLEATELPTYADKIDQEVKKAINDWPQFIKQIHLYVDAFNHEAGVIQDPIQLKLICNNLYKIHFGEDFDKDLFSYLDKVYFEKSNPVKKRIDALKIEYPSASNLCSNLWGGALLPFAVICCIVLNTQLDREYPSVSDLSVNPWRMTPLMFAVIGPIPSKVSLSINASEVANHAIDQASRLLLQGAEINAGDNYNRTALMYVAIGHCLFLDMDRGPGREELTRLLLEAGADPLLKDHLGKTALDYFREELGPDHRATQLIQEAIDKPKNNCVVASSSCSEPEKSILPESLWAIVGRAMTFFKSDLAPSAQYTPLTVRIEEEYICPITLVVMEDPVVAADGVTYEREAIAKWLKEKNTSPMTGEALSTTTLYPNRLIKDRIRSASKANENTAEPCRSPQRGEASPRF